MAAKKNGNDTWSTLESNPIVLIVESPLWDTQWLLYIHGCETPTVGGVPKRSFFRFLTPID